MGRLRSGPWPSALGPRPIAPLRYHDERPSADCARRVKTASFGTVECTSRRDEIWTVRIGSVLVRTSSTLVRISSTPVRTGSTPVRVSSALVRISSHPVRLGSTPVRTRCNPVRVGSDPVRTGFTPVQTMSLPVRTPSVFVRASAAPDGVQLHRGLERVVRRSDVPGA